MQADWLFRGVVMPEKPKGFEVVKKEQKEDKNYYIACQTIIVRFVFAVVLQSVFIIVIRPANSTNHTQS